jgi:hypothetical protein
VADRIVEDVRECVLVLLLRPDHLGLEPAPKDVVSTVVALVEGAGIAAVQVAHAVREVRFGRLDEQVVVIAQQAADVSAPSVAALDTAQDVEEDGAVGVLEEDRRQVVPARRDVVVRPGSEVAAWTTHLPRR